MSIINHEYKHGFIHVPKCAGTSMERQVFVGGNSHQGILELKRKAPHYFWWGFIRHPADRCLSVYSHMSQLPCSAFVLVDEQGREHSTGGVSLADFMHMLPYSYKRNMLTKPMVSYLCDKSLNILVDFVGRYEQLQRDWEIVQNKIKVQPKPLPITNKSHHNSWRDTFTVEWLKIIEDIYSDDYQVFGYQT